MDTVSRWNVARRYEKRSLLIAINAVASLSIFFFGYDQGVMGGVNNNRNYAKTMGFGHYNEQKGEVDVDHALLQGGIVCRGWAIHPSSIDHSTGCGLLSSGNPFWLSFGGLVW